MQVLWSGQSATGLPTRRPSGTVTHGSQECLGPSSGHRGHRGHPRRLQIAQCSRFLHSGDVNGAGHMHGNLPLRTVCGICRHILSWESPLRGVVGRTLACWPARPRQPSSAWSHCPPTRLTKRPNPCFRMTRHLFFSLPRCPEFHVCSS